MKPLHLALLALAFAPPAGAAEPADVVETYARIGAAVFGDTARAGHDLQAATQALIAAPSPATLAAARKAWRDARAFYAQTEVFRFGNPVVDDWEPGVNAWPLDEGFIDYVAPAYGGPRDENGLAGLNIVATPQIALSGRPVDARDITPDLIRTTLNEAEGIESNVASGWHAIEFLLWGQDLNGTGPGAGDRPYSDYLQGPGCTHGNCDRRSAYLAAATALLVSDLDHMAADWQPGGAARAVVTASPEAGLAALVTGMGSLALGEMAGERIRLGLMLNDPEEEQDCFSDNTHNSAWFDGVGMQNVWAGQYLGRDGQVTGGPGLSALVAATDPILAAAMHRDLDATMGALGAIRSAAEGGMAWDRMLAPGNRDGAALLGAAVTALTAQTTTLQRIQAAVLPGAGGAAPGEAFE